MIFFNASVRSQLWNGCSRTHISLELKVANDILWALANRPPRVRCLRRHPRLDAPAFQRRSGTPVAGTRLVGAMLAPAVSRFLLPVFRGGASAARRVENHLFARGGRCTRDTCRRSV